MAKMRPGIFTHRYVDFGNYQQCLDVVHEQDKFIGQYSLIQIRWNQSNHELYNFENFVSAICYPSTCEGPDIETILNHFNSQLDIEIKLITIETRETSSSGYSAPKIIAGLILLSLFGISQPFNDPLFLLRRGKDASSYQTFQLRIPLGKVDC